MTNSSRLCYQDKNNNIIKEEMYFNSKDSISAAKKAFRHFKNRNVIFLLNEDTNIVEAFDTSCFFDKKKDFDRNRKKHRKHKFM